MDLSIDWIPNKDLNSIAELLASLNEGKNTHDMHPIIAELQKRNYHCVGVKTEGKLIGICGVWPLYKHYVGKHIEVDNVTIDKGYRNLKIGESMIAFVEKWAVSEGFKAIELNAYVKNEAAHRFWGKVGFKNLGFHMRRKLE
ncbi:GNAT family N-acetyltransferase [Bacteroidia bacterium]|nr:GNAT family N-acetyltransferase [Bacteroidia bacterium]